MFDDSSDGASLLAHLLGAALQQAQQQQRGNDSSSVNRFLKAAIVGDTSACQSMMRKGMNPKVRGDNQLTAMHLAAHEGHADTVEALAKGGADLDAKDDDGDTPILVAAMRDKWSVVETLLRLGADLSVKNKKGVSVVDVTLLKGNVKMVSAMLQRSQGPKFVGGVDDTAVAKASQEGNLEVVKFWLEKHADPRACDRRLQNGRTIAFIAALNGHDDIIKLMVQQRANFDIPDEDGNTPIFCAAQNGHGSTLRLIMPRCTIDHRNSSGRTAVFSATVNEREEELRMLVDAGADVDVKDNKGHSPLACAIVSSCNDPIARFLASRTKDFGYVESHGYNYAHLAVIAKRLNLLKTMRTYGAMIDTPSPKDGETPLLAACQIGPPETVEYLLQQGCRSSHQNHHGVSPALRAACNKLIEIVRILIKHKAPLDLPNKIGETAILCSAEENCLPLVQLLHKHGCNLRVQDKRGKTIAYHAARHGNSQMLSYLDQHGVALDKSDNEGVTPLMALAGAEESSIGVAKMLLECGVRWDAKDAKGRSALEIADDCGNVGLVRLLQQRFGGGGPGAAQEMPTVRIRPTPDFKRPASQAPVTGDFKTWNFIYEDNKKKPIGSGGFGKVYKAYTDNHQFVAVKVVKPVGSCDAHELRRAYEQEKRGIELLKRVDHPNIVKFLKTEEGGNGNYYIFTELLSGLTILEIMQQQEKPIDETGVKKFLKQVCAGLGHLHGLNPPVLHRDIKCSNIMLTNPGIIKLIDFGFAREIATMQSVMSQQMVCGTPNFMAPEILTEEDRPQYTTKSDVWALGCTAFEMANGTPPNAEVRNFLMLARRITDGLMPKLEGASRELRDFYDVCVKKKPAERPDIQRLLNHHAFLKD